ncbi:MAG: arginine--tRNA ligase [Candidatus Parvarchaeota archaeon]|nr:arginine--tRNA ligase [Candidatus Parvarchaeota archaeon]MCW1301732.1 arginine--tRNA ligase [Candidatus Parvarchaeota archaeon]
MGSRLDIVEETLSDIAARLNLSSADEVRTYISNKTYGYGGDFSLILALKESKVKHIPPEKAAEEIKSKLSGMRFIKKVDAVNGYVNFWYDFEEIVKALSEGFDESYGRDDQGKGKRIMIEHTSVNPNKAIHIGHVRNSAIGDALSRLLNFVGYDVIVTNYIDDTGAQVADNVVGVKFLGFPRSKEGVKADHYLGDEVYVKVNKLYEKDPALMEKRSLVLKAMEEGSGELAALARDMVIDVLKGQLKTMERLGVFYDLINYESHILAYKFWATAFSQMKEIGAVKLVTDGDKKGCWVFSSSPQGDDKILVRSDGTVVYAGKDIAYAMWKHGLLKGDFRYKRFGMQRNGKELWTTTLDEESEEKHPVFNGVDQSISVVDIRQSYEQSIVKEAIERLSAGKPIRYVHYGYEVVALSPNTANKLGMNAEEKDVLQMSGRKGIYINADDFLDRLYGLILDETKDKNHELSEEECKVVAESLAVSVLRYEMIRTDPKKMIVFDIDEALNLESKGAVYIEYTLSRMAGIIRNSAEEDGGSVPIPDLSDADRKLLRGIIEFPGVIKAAAKNLDLVGIAGFMSSFASDFNNFYAKEPVLKAEGDLRRFRLWLVKASKQVLTDAASIVGMVPLDRM